LQKEHNLLPTGDDEGANEPTDSAASAVAADEEPEDPILLQMNKTLSSSCQEIIQRILKNTKTLGQIQHFLAENPSDVANGESLLDVHAAFAAVRSKLRRMVAISKTGGGGGFIGGLLADLPAEAAPAQHLFFGKVVTALAGLLAERFPYDFVELASTAHELAGLLGSTSDAAGCSLKDVF
jgi:hypothetical protein